MNAADDKMLFTCPSCGYRARIPNHYQGKNIQCPGCKVGVTATPSLDSGSVTGTTASFTKAQLAAGTTGMVARTNDVQPEGAAPKIVFACPACAYKGRLTADYLGKTIRCPGCQTAQVVSEAKGDVSPSGAHAAVDDPSDKIRFTCTACGYRARIPARYAGAPILCPGCKGIQMATPDEIEEATGRTVTVTKVVKPEISEARSPSGAMTNVGIQFNCGVCGYQSRISPSCAGDAIYCPSCRAPQKVEWGPPKEEGEAAGAADEPAAAPEAPEAEEVSSFLATLPPAQRAAPTTVKRGARRIVSSTPLEGSAEAAPEIAVEAEPAPVAQPAARAAGPASSGKRAQVAMKTPRPGAPSPAQLKTPLPSAPTRTPPPAADADADAGGDGEAAGEPAGRASGARGKSSRPVTERVAPSAAPAGRKPLVMALVAAVVLLAIAVVLLLQWNTTKGDLASTSALLDTAKRDLDTQTRERKAAEEEIARQKKLVEETRAALATETAARKEAEAVAESEKTARQKADSAKAEEVRGRMAMEGARDEEKKQREALETRLNELQLQLKAALSGEPPVNVPKR